MSQRKYNNKIFQVNNDGHPIREECKQERLNENKRPDFLEEHDLIQNLYEASEQKDETLKLCLQKAIDSKNAWNVIHSNGEISKQNGKIQRIIIIRTIILGIGAILQILTNIFDKEISSRNLCFKLYITFVILSFTIIGIVMYRYSTKDK